jgi:glycosyltransferase involved in cell wall biosynthesis
MPRPRDVFFFTDSDGFGGAETALLSLIRGLNRDRWSPSLIFHQSSGVEPLVEGAAEASCELIPVPVMPEGLAGARRAVKFTRLLSRRRPQVFHAHLAWPLACKFGLAAAVAARVPAVVATYQLVPPFRLRRRAWVQQRVLGSRLGRMIAVSRDTASRLEILFGWPAEKITVVYNGVPTPHRQLPKNSELRRQLLGDQQAVVLVPARLDPLKGHEFLFEAAHERAGIQVVVAGEGPERERLRTLAEQLGISDRVTFLGYREDVPDLLACADVVVLPSLAEGLPLVVLETMAVGTPLVATAIGGTNEAVLDEVTGILVPPRDAAALAEAIERVLTDPAEARRRTEAASARLASEFTTDRMVAKVESVYDALLDG